MIKSIWHRWPVELAEKLLANLLPWGPPTYALGRYIDDPDQPDQSYAFFALANCVDGAFKNRGYIDEAWKWANPIMKHIKEGSFCTIYSTQDLLDIVFLCVRGERLEDGLIRFAEPILREIVQEVVRRVRSAHPPVFLIAPIIPPT